MTISVFIGLNPLQTTWTERGIVSSRVALLLRSAEIQPLFLNFGGTLAGTFPSLRGYGRVTCIAKALLTALSAKGYPSSPVG